MSTLAIKILAHFFYFVYSMLSKECWHHWHHPYLSMIVLKKGERNHWKARQLCNFSRKQQHDATSYLPYNIMGSNSLDLKNLYFHQLLTIKKMTKHNPYFRVGSEALKLCWIGSGWLQNGQNSMLLLSNIKPGWTQFS